MAESPHEAKYAVADQRMFRVKRCWGAVMVVALLVYEGLRWGDSLEIRKFVAGGPSRRRLAEAAPRRLQTFPPDILRGMLQGTKDLKIQGNQWQL